MAKQYIPIFLDWMKVTEELSDEEKGRLINALVVYASHGDWMAEIEGNERFLFPAFREQVNRSNEISQARSAARICSEVDGADKRMIWTEREQEKETESTPNKRNKPKQNETMATKAHEEEEEEEKKEEKEEKKKGSLSAADDRFTAFWHEYPKHAAKQDALRAWRKLRPDGALIDRMMTSLAACKKSDEWTREGGRFIPYPATWLNGHRWEDEVSPPSRAAPLQTKLVIAQDYEQRDYSAVDDELKARQIAEMEVFLRESPEEKQGVS